MRPIHSHVFKCPLPCGKICFALFLKKGPSICKNHLLLLFFIERLLRKYCLRSVIFVWTSKPKLLICLPIKEDTLYIVFGDINIIRLRENPNLVLFTKCSNSKVMIKVPISKGKHQLRA